MHPVRTTLAFVALLLCTNASLGQDLGGKTQSNESLTTPSRPSELLNGDFETINANGDLTTWFFIGQGGGKLDVDSAEKHAGNRSAHISTLHLTKADSSLFSNVMQSIDATQYRGKKVRLRSFVRAGSLYPGSSIQMWMRVDGKSEANGGPVSLAFDNMADRAIKNTDWQSHEIVLPIDPNAEGIVLGAFLIGKGEFWIDDATLEVVSDETQSTAATSNPMPMPQIDPIVLKAIQDAENAPRQPFWTPWLFLPAACIVFSIIGLIPIAKVGDRQATIWLRLQQVCLRFSCLYWGSFSVLQILSFGGGSLLIAYVYEPINSAIVHWIAESVFGLGKELVPPNGSGDTTYDYLSLLWRFFLSLVVAVAWSAFDWRKSFGPGTQDLVRSLLRYAIALCMLVYGTAKVTFDGNQFPENSTFQLDKTWGDSSPMNVLWAFMGSSRPYTFFGGLGELLAMLLIIWRRTAFIGAAVSFGVMLNVMMMNYCFDVPVKIFSTHLVIMSLLVMLPDLPRFISVFVLNRPTLPIERHGIWQGQSANITRLALKSLFIATTILFPLAMHSWNISTQIATRIKNPPAKSKADSEYLLERRGFRWINEVPFNR